MSAQADRDRRDRERAEALSQVGALDVTRHLIRSAAPQLEQARVWTLLADEAARRADAAAERARLEGEPFTAIAAALHMTRQGARKRYGHLESVG